jgi:hypothetical protein
VHTYYADIVLLCVLLSGKYLQYVVLVEGILGMCGEPTDSNEVYGNTAQQQAAAGEYQCNLCLILLVVIVSATIVTSFASTVVTTLAGISSCFSYP